MRILLIGEYSNVHRTLRDALRRQGHEVLLVSDGDGWKDYPRDIDLRRRHPGPLGSLLYLAQVVRLLPRMRGYDVVQVINPIFLDVKPRWNRWFFDYLRRHNRRVSVGCYGDDYYVISRMQDDRYLAYTDFYACGRKIEHEVNQRRMAAWLHSPKAGLTQYVMARADCLVACLYEYWKVYDTPEFRDRLHYVPLPVEVGQQTTDNGQRTTDNRQRTTDNGQQTTDNGQRSVVKILFAAQKKRGQMKGTDQLEPLFDRLAREHADSIELRKIVSVPFDEYRQLVSEADVIVDQLYSFTPAMAALECLSQGKIVVSGYEEEYRQYIGAEAVSGIINLRPFDDEQNYRILVDTLTDDTKIAQLKQSSQAFVRRYHDADRVAAEYLRVWGLTLRPDVPPTGSGASL